MASSPDSSSLGSLTSCCQDSPKRGTVANLPLAFAELLAGGILITAGASDPNGSVANVLKGADHGLAPIGKGSSTTATGTPGTGSTPPALNTPVGKPSGTLTGSYINPTPQVSGWTRVDQGVDLTLSGNYLAPGNSHVLYASDSNSGWAGGGYMALQLLDGPYAGSVYYVSEGIKALVQAGQTVTAGTPIAAPATNPYNGVWGNIETGWAQPHNFMLPLAQATGPHNEVSTAAGESFNTFLQGLGAAGGHLVSTVFGSLAGIGPGSL